MVMVKYKNDKKKKCARIAYRSETSEKEVK